MADINKKSLEHLADLARLKLETGEEEKFLKDLGNILDHFKELQELNTDEIQPMTGGTSLKSVMRGDEIFEEDHYIDADKIRDQFPEHQAGHLKVPPVFE
ncbi:MAG: Asp-tRNA(Asn)/Glu-tRNA(Gln) amidotransferase subunit GatC [bacterium]|nr:Asp-tRNA(Asn)/Glu-tRNA(Gln) amidotransferase subunit GatC [bacterium]